MCMCVYMCTHVYVIACAPPEHRAAACRVLLQEQGGAGAGAAGDGSRHDAAHTVRGADGRPAAGGAKP